MAEGGCDAPECPLCVTSRHLDLRDECPLYPRKRTFLEAVQMSAKCQKRTLTEYVEADHNKMTAKPNRIRALADVPYPVHMEPNLVVEYYSR